MTNWKKKLHYWTQREILAYSKRAYKYIKKLMQIKKYDVTHAFFGIPSGAIAYLFKKEIPYVVSLRGSDVPGFNKRFSLQYVFLKPIIKKIWSEASAVISNSAGLKQLALKTSPNQEIGIIYNGVDINKFKPIEEKNNEIFTILCVARLIERKGIDYLINAIPLVLEKQRDVRLILVGEGNLENELKKLCKDLDLEEYVLFKGRVEHDDLPDLYSSSDVFVLPSKNEGMSNTVLEAMASGLPIITTDTGGTQELIKDNGIVVHVEDSKTIASAILHLADDYSLCKTMGTISRKIADGLSWKKVAENYLEIYKKVTG
ncbi:MAG TPA: glycosyltransferase family 4 protein [Methanosarcinales archaeon]|nr:glycosyltransferase family 4 protein [Methanosarcinales archaeon]